MAERVGMAGWLDPVIMFSQTQGFLPGLIQISTEKFPAVREGSQELFISIFVFLFRISHMVKQIQCGRGISKGMHMGKEILATDLQPVSQ